jgi:hypothetical protein
MFVPDKHFQPTVMQHRSLLGKFVSYEENQVLWIRPHDFVMVLRIWIVYIGVEFKAITPATVTGDSHYCTCLGHLGRRDTDRIVSIFCRITQGGQGVAFTVIVASVIA